MKFWILYGIRLPRCLKIKCCIENMRKFLISWRGDSPTDSGVIRLETVFYHTRISLRYISQRFLGFEASFEKSPSQKLPMLSVCLLVGSDGDLCTRFSRLQTFPSPRKRRCLSSLLAGKVLTASATRDSRTCFRRFRPQHLTRDCRARTTNN